jgi:hypothetical protein
MRTNANKPMPDGDPIDPDLDGQIMKFVVDQQKLTNNT